MALSKYLQGQIPFRDKIIDSVGLISAPWQDFLRYVKSVIDPLGLEKNYALANNQTSFADIVGLAFNSAQVSQAIVDYLIQRVTTGSGATAMLSSGCLHLVYNPKSEAWEIISPVIPLAGTFTAATDDVCTKNAHNLIFGQQVQLTSTTTLPAGLSSETTYWVIPLSENTFKLASSLTNALSGTAVDITSTGSGTHTITPNPGVDFSVTASGQVQYKTSNITGTASISKITYRARTLGAKNIRYSQFGPIV